MNVSLALATILGLVGCGSRSQTPSGLKADTVAPKTPHVVYQKAFDCGAAGELDVDTGERRQLKLVIKDGAAIAYLESKLAPGGVLSTGVLGANGSEETTRGTMKFFAKRGVFKPSDLSLAQLFGGFTGDSNEYATIDNEASGIKIRLANFTNVRTTCLDGAPVGDTNQGCERKTTILQEDANWFFHCKTSF